MNMPTVMSTIRDPEKRITYQVMAFRGLTREELVTAVRMYRSSVKKAPKPGSTVTILTVIGARD